MATETQGKQIVYIASIIYDRDKLQGTKYTYDTQHVISEIYYDYHTAINKIIVNLTRDGFLEYEIDKYYEKNFDGEYFGIGCYKCFEIAQRNSDDFDGSGLDEIVDVIVKKCFILKMQKIINGNYNKLVEWCDKMGDGRWYVEIQECTMYKEI